MDLLFVIEVFAEAAACGALVSLCVYVGSKGF